jgi:hypothetical protein
LLNLNLANVRKITFFSRHFVFVLTSTAQNPPNWASNQLIEPSTLAQMLREENSLPLIFNVGLDPVIPHSVNIGTGQQKGKSRQIQKTTKHIAEGYEDRDLLRLLSL